MNITISVFVRKVFEAIRAGCDDEGITQGAIGVCITPKLKEEANWARIPSGISDALFISPISLSGETTLYSEKEGFAGDAFGVVAMKISATKIIMARYDKEEDVTRRKMCTSGSLPDDMLGNGIVNWKGAIAVPIDVVKEGSRSLCYGCRFYNKRAMNVYVAVSGGTEEQDERSAWRAVDAINEIIEAEDVYKFADGY